MLSVRNAVASAAILFVLVIGFSLLGMMQVPDSGGAGVDSYGTRGRGFRALFETLDLLDVAVSRDVSPPTASDLPPGTLAIFSPSPLLVGTGPTYLSDLHAWVNDGGRVVVAAAPPDSYLMQMQMAQFKEPPPTILEALGLTGVEVIGTGTGSRLLSARERATYHERSAETVASDIFDQLNAPPPPLQRVDVSVSGEFRYVNETVHELTIPVDGVAALTCTQEPDGAILWKPEHSEPVMLAARFQKGRGEVIVVADATLFTNRLIVRSDNSLLAAYSLSPDGQPVRFDEFYHGLGVRGQPLYLLTEARYASVAFGVLMVLALWTWRKTVLPGPPLPDESNSRRDIAEYINAMGRFFSEGGKGRGRLVQELRNGVLRQISMIAGLPPDTGDVELIANTIGRKDKRRAAMLLEAVRTVDADLDSKRHWTETQTIEAMRRMSACL